MTTVDIQKNHSSSLLKNESRPCLMQSDVWICSLLPLITAVQLTGVQGGARARHAAPIRLQPGKEGVL